MKLIGSTLVAGGVLIGSIYVYNNYVNQDNTESPQKRVSMEVQGIKKNEVSTILHNTGIGQSGITQTFSGTIPFNEESSSLGTVELSQTENTDDWVQFLDQDPNLKAKVQGMSWHQSCLSNNTEKEVCMEYSKKANEVEELLKKNPKYLSRLQQESWWQKYLSGVITPSEILISQLPNFQIIQDFEQKNPDEYEKISQSPIWNKFQDPYNPNPDELINYQARFLEDVHNIQRAISENPNLSKRFEEYGLNMDSLLNDTNMGSPDSIYNTMSNIIIIEKEGYRDKVKLSRFLNSEIGKSYAAGTADIKIAVRSFMNS